MVGTTSGGWEKFHMVGEHIILVNTCMFSSNILKINQFSLKFLLGRGEFQMLRFTGSWKCISDMLFVASTYCGFQSAVAIAT
jgi:hypothetical protein